MMNIESLQLRDKILTCVECRDRFVWTSGEQRYFLSKELSQPKRCPDCRAIRKASLVSDGGNHG